VCKLSDREGANLKIKNRTSEAYECGTKELSRICQANWVSLERVHVAEEDKENVIYVLMVNVWLEF
jgi:hypothetical protein